MFHLKNLFKKKPYKIVKLTDSVIKTISIANNNRISLNGFTTIDSNCSSLVTEDYLHKIYKPLKTIICLIFSLIILFLLFFAGIILYENHRINELERNIIYIKENYKYE
ncbi:MAG: hypothetical protein J6C46_00580 [Clostridia bacterium]|nr:hypothetical protein [Clostridia bacterium]